MFKLAIVAMTAVVAMAQPGGGQWGNPFGQQWGGPGQFQFQKPCDPEAAEPEPHCIDCSVAEPGDIPCVAGFNCLAYENWNNPKCYAPQRKADGTWEWGKNCAKAAIEDNPWAYQKAKTEATNNEANVTWDDMAWYTPCGCYQWRTYYNKQHVAAGGGGGD